MPDRTTVMDGPGEGDHGDQGDLGDRGDQGDQVYLGEGGDRGDIELMQRAIAVADAVRGTTAPNPWVGCVVVSGHDPALVFEGATAPPGGPHAEVTALARAGDLHSRGSTLFTTLEPCVHQGRTPPCTDAIIAAGVSRVGV